jgi:hypothetical protein
MGVSMEKVVMTFLLSMSIITMHLLISPPDDTGDMSGVYYVATSGDKLYYTNSNTYFVTCCDLHGTTQWEFKNDRVLKCPYNYASINFASR